MSPARALCTLLGRFVLTRMVRVALSKLGAVLLLVEGGGDRGVPASSVALPRTCRLTLMARAKQLELVGRKPVVAFKTLENMAAVAVYMAGRSLCLCFVCVCVDAAALSVHRRLPEVVRDVV